MSEPQPIVKVETLEENDNSVEGDQGAEEELEWQKNQNHRLREAQRDKESGSQQRRSSQLKKSGLQNQRNLSEYKGPSSSPNHLTPASPTTSRRLSGNVSAASSGYSDSDPGGSAKSNSIASSSAADTRVGNIHDIANFADIVSMGGIGYNEALANSSAVKLSKRRPHSKSRRGCATCKRRRVKCDETHPRCKNCEHLGLECSFQASNSTVSYSHGPLNMVDLKLFYNYTTVVWKTITAAGISSDQVWGEDVPKLAFEYEFLMRSLMTFSATHLSRSYKGIYDNAVTVHRGEALRLLREEVQQVTPKNLDALVAASVLLILDALANAALPDEMSPSSLPPSAWLHHVRGAATILLAVGPLPPESKFYRLVNIDLSDLADSSSGGGGISHMAGLLHQGILPGLSGTLSGMSGLVCFDDELKDLYPVHTSSPYFQTLVYIDKLFHQRYKSDFILRVFSFPALLDRNLLQLLGQGDGNAKKIIRVYYKLVRSFTSEMRDKVWFLEGVSKVLPIDMDSDFGGLGFITSALPVSITLDTMLTPFGETTINGILGEGRRFDEGGGRGRDDEDIDMDMMSVQSTSFGDQQQQQLDDEQFDDDEEQFDTNNNSNNNIDMSSPRAINKND